jgi:hypothetical protein
MVTSDGCDDGDYGSPIALSDVLLCGVKLGSRCNTSHIAAASCQRRLHKQQQKKIV